MCRHVQECSREFGRVWEGVNNCKERGDEEEYEPERKKEKND